jgi:hypothetical protein
VSRLSGVILKKRRKRKKKPELETNWLTVIDNGLGKQAANLKIENLIMIAKVNYPVQYIAYYLWPNAEQGKLDALHR